MRMFCLIRRKEGTNMPVDMSLLLKNVRIAFANGQRASGMWLLDYAIRLADEALSPLPPPLDTAIALDPGVVRQSNEDCVLAVQGTLKETQEVFGLFVICDGMGGHIHGLDAAHLAIETIAESVFPSLLKGSALVAIGCTCWSKGCRRRIVPSTCAIRPSLGPAMMVWVKSAHVKGRQRR